MIIGCFDKGDKCCEADGGIGDGGVGDGGVGDGGAVRKTCLCLLGRIAYKFNRGVDASQPIS